MQSRVVWKEGLFIRPQHFQQSDRHFTQELMTRTKELRSNAWGFFNLEIDQYHLASGKIVLNNASGIMPDGTLFNVSSKTNTLSIDIQATDISKDIFLALPIMMHNSDEIRSEEQTNRLTRFVSKALHDVVNCNAGEESSVDILGAYHNYKLILEDDINEGYVKLKLGNIEDVSASGVVSLDKTYMPIYLHLNAASLLLSKMGELIGTISYRTERLSEKLSDANVQATELGDYLMLQVLNKAQARLHFFMHQERIHPMELFLELSSLVAELAVFMKKRKRLLEQFEYNHQLQGESFDIVISELNDMLSLVLEQNSIALPVEAKKYGVYISKITDKSIIASSSFIFAVKADMGSDQLKKILLANLKMGTAETIRNLVNYHLVGFILKPLASAPRQIPYKVNYLYFQVELSTSDRERLVHSGGFAFHISHELPGVDYTLWAIRNN